MENGSFHTPFLWQDEHEIMFKPLKGDTPIPIKASICCGIPEFRWK